jgi:hypothetical protein
VIGIGDATAAPSTSTSSISAGGPEATEKAMAQSQLLCSSITAPALSASSTSLSKRYGLSTVGYSAPSTSSPSRPLKTTRRCERACCESVADLNSHVYTGCSAPAVRRAIAKVRARGAPPRPPLARARASSGASTRTVASRVTHFEPRCVPTDKDVRGRESNCEQDSRKM